MTEETANVVKKSKFGNLPGPGPGRPKGVRNKAHVALKEAVLQAAEEVGWDGTGKGGLVGFLKRMIETDLKAFASLLGKLIPTNIVADITVHPAEVTDEIMTPDQWAKQHQPTAH